MRVSDASNKQKTFVGQQEQSTRNVQVPQQIKGNINIDNENMRVSDANNKQKTDRK
jgi:hypothetical protein